jgi:hypothetical protein
MQITFYSIPMPIASNRACPIFFQTLMPAAVSISTSSTGNFVCKIALEGLGLQASWGDKAIAFLDEYSKFGISCRQWEQNQ